MPSLALKTGQPPSLGATRVIIQNLSLRLGQAVFLITLFLLNSLEAAYFVYGLNLNDKASCSPASKVDSLAILHCCFLDFIKSTEGKNLLKS